jgi:type IV pilus assembly protein PilE
MLSRRRSATARGFTLIESMVVLAILAVLATLSYPSFAAQLRKARRCDAITRLARVQQAQERWRAEHASYGSLADTGVAARTADGLYQLSVSDNQGTGYVAVAEAQGRQLADVACRFMRITIDGGNAVLASGPDAGVGNPPAINQRCWNQ